MHACGMDGSKTRYALNKIRTQIQQLQPAVSTIVLLSVKGGTRYISCLRCWKERHWVVVAAVGDYNCGF